MNPVVVVSIFVGVILLLLVVGAPFKPFRFLGQAAVKFLIGMLVLFLLNAVGAHFAFRLPINAVTAFIAGFLGVPGIVALAVIKYAILP